MLCASFYSVQFYSIKSILYIIELCKEVTHTNSATLIYGVNENNLIDDKVDKGKTKFHSYSSIYSDLAKVLNKKSSKLFVLPKVLTYQDLLKDFKIDSKVKDFYQL